MNPEHDSATLVNKCGEQEDCENRFLNSKGYALHKKEKEISNPKGIVFISHGLGEHCDRFGYEVPY